jgi:hypothetical protein
MAAVVMDEHKDELDPAKYLAWERDAINRLYYGLWVVFLGGFVLSLHVVAYRQSCLVIVLLIVFRLLAIAGTAVNFFMQHQAIGSLSSIKAALDYAAFNHEISAGTELKKARESERIVAGCEKLLQIIAGAFLLIAFAGSFLVHLP